MSSINTKILKLWIAIQITSPFPFPFRPSNLREKKKEKRHLTPPSRFTRHVRTRFTRVPFCSSRECYKEKKRGQRGGVFQVVVKSISQLGHWVIRWMMIRGYLERSPPITVRTTAEKGGRVGIPLQGDVAKNKRPWGKRNSEIRENSCGEGRDRNGN